MAGVSHARIAGKEEASTLNRPQRNFLHYCFVWITLCDLTHLWSSIASDFKIHSGRWKLPPVPHRFSGLRPLESTTYC